MEVISKRTINATRVKLAEYDRQEWTVNAELGTELEDLLVPGYWAHVSSQMQPYDHIEVRIDDGAWVAYLLVTAADRNWAKVKILAKYDLVDDHSVPQTAVMHEVHFKGPQHKWSVIRKSDGAYVHEGSQTRAEASAWMVNHEKTI